MRRDLQPLELRELEAGMDGRMPYTFAGEVVAMQRLVLVMVLLVVAMSSPVVGLRQESAMEMERSACYRVVVSIDLVGLLRH